MEAVCAGFLKPPVECKIIGAYDYHFLKSYNTTLADQITEAAEGWSAISIICLILVIIIVNLILAFLVIRYLKRRVTYSLDSRNIDDKITSTITTYLALGN